MRLWQALPGTLARESRDFNSGYTNNDNPGGFYSLLLERASYRRYDVKRRV